LWNIEPTTLEKKRFAFIEMETHSALLEQWYLLLKEMNSIDASFFVHEKVLRKLSSIPKDKITIVTSVSEINVQDFDGVVVNTLHRNFETYSDVFLQKPVLCLVHNINFGLFFRPINWKNILLDKERLIYFLKLYLREKVGTRRKAILKAKQFGVLSKSLLDVVKEDGRYSNRTKLVQMNYCHSHSLITTSEKINIVIPGNVTNKRKDIEMVFDLLPKLHPKTKLHFTFLGKPESPKVLEQLEQLQQNCSESISVTHYHNFIPWEEYSRVIAKAHLLLCPIKEKASFYLVDEFYGKTKVSGSEADCIYNGKIGLFPTSYPKMNWHNLYYENANDLSSILNNLTQVALIEEYEKLKPFLDQYTFESVKNELEELLLQIANSK
jgi:hypothetical protein